MGFPSITQPENPVVVNFLSKPVSTAFIFINAELTLFWELGEGKGAFLRRLIWVLFAFLTLASSATAGPWPRAEGEYFISAGGNFLLSEGATLPVHYDPTLYLEYGMTDKLTVGLDIHTADAGRIGTMFVFASFPLSSPEQAHKFSATLSLGARANILGQTDTLIRGGMSWGKGLENGWLSIDASATWGTHDPVFRPKIDATYGHNWSDKWTTSIQLQTGQGFTNDYYAKVVPSASYKFRDDLRVSVGGVQALTGDRGFGLKVETWLTF